MKQPIDNGAGDDGVEEDLSPGGEAVADNTLTSKATLAGANTLASWSYTYDADYAMLTQVFSCGYDNVHRLTSYNGNPIQYDWDGNRTAYGAKPSHTGGGGQPVVDKAGDSGGSNIAKSISSPTSVEPKPWSVDTRLPFSSAAVTPYGLVRLPPIGTLDWLRDKRARSRGSVHPTRCAAPWCWLSSPTA